ncbi:MAG: HPr family phosphocarrier protein [Thermodesulfobacteriota bacterium]
MTAPKISKMCTIRNKLGLHARAAAKFVQTASRFKCDVRLARNGEETDGKSILDILTLACLRGTEVEIRAVGEDAPEAVSALEKLINDKFGEEQ